MCGIAGIIIPGRATMDRETAAAAVRAMTVSLAHRGPDADGIWLDPLGRCALGHRRLAIIDISEAGRQPMHTADGRWVITFNGEIYNFQQLRRELEATGAHLRTRTDTEVLIELIARRGAAALTAFDGMFAFAAFDTTSGETILARDPFGEKPLYYTTLDDGTFAFASELQALERVPGFDGHVDAEAIAELLAFQYIGAPRSIYRSVHKLPPGHWMRVAADGSIHIERYFRFQPGALGFVDRPIDDLADELEEILTRSLERRLISDVPLGAFLSGGVDSSVTCALARRRLNRPLMTFSMGFKDFEDSEHPVARAFAEHLGTEHHEEIVEPDAAHFLTGIGGLQDEPNADSSCLPTYLLSGLARRHVTVAVSGDGGDEMFCGYGRYLATMEESTQHAAGQLPNWRLGQAYYSDRILIATETQLAELFDEVPLGLTARISQLRQELDTDRRPVHCRMRSTDVVNYMPGAVLSKVDRMSMRHSLEVRTPFLNVELARFAERLPEGVLVRNGVGKILLRRLAERHLPAHLVALPKKGFGLPATAWAREQLLATAEHLLGSDDSRLAHSLGRPAVQRFLDRQRSSGGFAVSQLWSMSVLESWFRHHPAKLPILSSASSRPVRAKPAGHAARLVLKTVAPGTFATWADHTVAAEQAGGGNPTWTSSRAIAWLIHEATLAARRSKTEIGSDFDLTQTLTIPGWREKVTKADRSQELLRNATLVFLDRDAGRRLNARECRKLARLGICRLVFESATRAGHLCVLHLRNQSPMDRLLRYFRLRRHAVAVLRHEGGWRHLLGTEKWIKGKGRMRYSRPLPQLQAKPNAEKSGAYALFEGTRQLPPIPATHADIAHLGGGRYSIKNGSVFLSPTSERALQKHSYWLVKRKKRLEKYLDYVFEDPFPRAAAEVFEQQVEALFAADTVAGGPMPLPPGSRVVVFTHALPPGGAERQWCYLAIALKDAGFDVFFVVSDPLHGNNAHYLPLLQAAHIRVIEARSQTIEDVLHSLPKKGPGLDVLASAKSPFAGLLAQVHSVFVKLAPDVVFAQLDEPNLLAAIAARIAEVPRIVVSFRNYSPWNFSYLRKAWYLPAYQALSMSQRVLFSGNSRDANDDYARWIGISPARVGLVPNGIDEADSPRPHDAEVARLRKELGVSATTPVILGVFRLSEEKDPLTFIDTCAKVHSAVPTMRAFIAGVGSMHDQVIDRIAAHGLGEAVTLLGRRRDVNALLRVASLLLHTSAKEGMPNAIMEAQMLECPIVATRAGGTPDCVTDKVTAILAPIGDVDALATACIELLRDPDRGRSMGRAGNELMRTQYPRHLMALRYIDLVRNGQSSGTSQHTEKRPDLAPASVA